MDKEKTAPGASDLTEGVIWKKLLGFFFPILFGMLFQQLYNTADAIVVGQFVGTRALAAVGGSASMIINLIIGFFTGLSSGATVIISQCFGARDDERLSRTEHTIVSFCLLTGAVISAVAWFAAPWALRLVRNPADTMADSVVYLRIYFLGVVGLGMGVAGAAWATVLAQLISALLVMGSLMRAPKPLRLRPDALGIDRAALRSTLGIGVSAGVQSAMYSVSNIIIQAAVNDLGTSIVAAWTATSKIDGIFWVTSNAFGITICAFVGQCFGAGKVDRLRKSVRVCFALALGNALVMSAGLIGFAQPLLRLVAAHRVDRLCGAPLAEYPLHQLLLSRVLGHHRRGAGAVLSAFGLAGPHGKRGAGKITKPGL